MHPTSGNLNMTTVSQSDGLTLGQALALWMSGTRAAGAPRPGLSAGQVARTRSTRTNTTDFKQSEDSAEYAALALPEVPEGRHRGERHRPGPVGGQAGGRRRHRHGRTTSRWPTSSEFTAILKATKPGDQLVVDYRRKDGDLGTTTITLGKNPDRDYGFLGVGVLDAPWAPFTIDFNLANIGGPSAGLMFSLAVVDKLTTGDLNGGKFVAGTGTITGDGKVGPIGGITHKISRRRKPGATVFLVPADNCDEAKYGARGRAAADQGGEPDRCRRRAADRFRRWRTSPLLRSRLGESDA